MFFDPIRLLRIAPLIGTTGSLVEAAAELVMMGALTNPRIRRPADELLPAWFTEVFPRSGSAVLLLNTLTTSTAIANVAHDFPLHGLWLLSTKLYLAGLVAAVGHMAFAPWVIGPFDTPVWNIIEDRAKAGAQSEMRRWVALHRVRMLVADLPAWLACLGAVLATSSL